MRWGELWLARNALGTLRAVKMGHRHAHDEETVVDPVLSLIDQAQDSGGRRSHRVRDLAEEGRLSRLTRTAMLVSPMSRLKHPSPTRPVVMVAGLVMVVAALWWFTASRLNSGSSTPRASVGPKSGYSLILQRALDPIPKGPIRGAYSSAQPAADLKAAPQFHPDTRASSTLAGHRAAILHSAYGTAPIEQVLHALVGAPGGPETQLILQALALRKAEALPIVRAKLHTGVFWEKVMLTKFLVHCAWPETLPELLALARADAEPWLVRQGAISALGALGDTAIGPHLAAVLRRSESPIGLQLAAIAALAKTGYREGTSVLRPFAQDEDPHLRLFAVRALAELGEPVAPESIKSALHSGDYVVRLEACEALSALDGADLLETLQTAARSDVHEAVRDAAAQALLIREIRGQTLAEKVSVLQRALTDAGRLTSLWILRTLLREGGQEGRALVETLGTEDTWLGERCRTHLILTAGN